MVSKRKIIVAIFLGCFGIIMAQAVSAATCPAVDGTLNCASVGKVACGGTCVLASSISSITCTSPATFSCSACACTGIQPWSVNYSASNAIYNNLNSSVGIGTMYPGEALDVNGAITVNNNNSQLFGWDGGYGYVGGIRMNQNYDSKVGYDTIVRNGPSGLMLLNQYGLSISAAPYRVTGAKFYDGTYGNLFIGNNAKIGIGTTNPVYSLSVDNNFNGNNAIIATNINSGTGVASMVGAGNGGTLQDVVRVAAYGTAFTTNGSAKQDGAELRAGPNLTGGLSITSMSTNANADIRFYTGGARDANQRMVIESTGNVGIGTSSPATKLSIAGTVSATGDICTGSKCLNSIGSSQWSNNGTSIYYNGGKVGIGTNSPNSTLDVKGAPNSNGVINLSAGSGTPTWDWSMIRFGENDIADAKGSHWWYLTKRTDGSGNADGRFSIYEHTTDNQYLERLTVNKGGNIGIGTTNPVYSLSVDNNFNGNNAIIATNINSGTGVASMVGAGNGGTLQDVVRVAAYGTAFTTNGSAKQDGAELRAGPNLTGGLSITSMSTNANADIRFYTGGAGDANQRMVIESTGNVGIGTSSPATKLSIAGTVSATGNMQINKSTAELLVGNNTANTLRLVGALSGASYIQVGIDGSDATGALTVSRRNTTNLNISKLNVYADNSYFSGNVGIGTSTPTSKLHVSGGLRVTSSSTLGSTVIDGRTIAFVTGGSAWIGTQDSNVFALRTNKTNRITIDGSGNVGIGTSIPTSKLHVSGGLRVTSSSTLGSTVIDGRTIAFVTGGSAWIGTQDSNVFALRTNKTNRITIDGSGNVGIGKMPSQALDVSGNITGSGEINGQYLHIKGGGDNDIVGNLGVTGVLSVTGSAVVQDSSGLNGKIQIKKTPSTTALPPCEEGNRGEVRLKECTTVSNKCKDRLVVCAWHDNEIFGGGNFVWLSVSWKDVVAQ